MKILVIFTGGTIGSASGKKWITLDDSTNYTLIDDYVNKEGNSVSFDAVSPYSILSENLSGSELTKLCNLLIESVKKDYDGIIVTHGTDTIQYTASAIAYTVNAKNVPILLVSANYPLEDERTNGRVNFKAAVDFIKSKNGGGVFVSYQNAGEDKVKIHLATSVIGHAEAMDEIHSLGGKTFAEVLDGKVFITEKINERIINEEERKVEFTSSPNVLMINSFPGDEFNYNLDGYNAVLIKPYHSGTLNTESKRLAEFCEKAEEKGVPVFLTNVPSGKAYESSKTYKNLSLYVLPFCTIPSIYVKIWLAVSLKKDVKEFVLNEISGEFSN